MKSIQNILDGKKTYIVAGLTILYCILGVGLHYMALPAALAFIGTTGSIAALRIGVSKAQAILEVILEVLKLLNQPAQPVQPVTPTPVETPVTPAVPTPVVPATS